jgi:hypothetical protein
MFLVYAIRDNCLELNVLFDNARDAVEYADQLIINIDSHYYLPTYLTGECYNKDGLKIGIEVPLRVATK